ncbi:uncharacterized protein LOC113233852 [Hyposmocoma kahamanoa]|uniref:uncharacterized protein LOC113233852 n=1 Tax=Hyposmocoma kahamanoa TaxID=1477025 RepID=UPI000E6DA364|nr:uncharacterized protein LOC113233852 [Hyposmocoma kahamanoa]
MPDRKFIKTLFIETVLFISLFALFSHMAVNFWERHVIQKELVKMKSSLYTLKGTVNNIGLAYDHLHDELKTLVVFADNPYPSERESFEQKRNPQQDHVQTTLRSYGKDVGPKTTLSLKSTGVTAKPEYPNHSPKVRPRYASRSGCSSRYHEKCAPH